MIGIFDSWIWWMSYVKELKHQLPEYDFIYLWDQLRVPYWNRSIESIRDFTEKGVLKLWEKGATLIIIACNTACSEALRFLQNKYPDQKILWVLIPWVEKSIEKKWNIWVIATRWTIKTNSYPLEICKRDPDRKVFQVEAPLLVPFIEEWQHKKPVFKKVLKTYLRHLKDANIKILILWCTHYSHAFKVFKAIVWTQVEIINPSNEAVLKLKQYFVNHPDIEKTLSKTWVRDFYTTDNKEFFKKQSVFFYWEEINVKKIGL